MGPFIFSLHRRRRRRKHSAIWHRPSARYEARRARMRLVRTYAVTSFTGRIKRATAAPAATVNNSANVHSTRNQPDMSYLSTPALVLCPCISAHDTNTNDFVVTAIRARTALRANVNLFTNHWGTVSQSAFFAVY